MESDPKPHKIRNPLFPNKHLTFSLSCTTLLKPQSGFLNLKSSMDGIPLSPDTRKGSNSWRVGLQHPSPRDNLHRRINDWHFKLRVESEF